MKKILTLTFLFLLLSACNSKQTSTVEENSNLEKEACEKSGSELDPIICDMPECKVTTLFESIEKSKKFQTNHQKMSDKGYSFSNQKMSLTKESYSASPTIFGDAYYTYSKEGKKDITIHFGFWHHITTQIEEIRIEE